MIVSTPKLKRVMLETGFKYTFFNPLISRSNVIKIYWYRFLSNRKELVWQVGKVFSVRKRNTYTGTSVVCIQRKLFGIKLVQYFPLNSPALVALRVIS